MASVVTHNGQVYVVRKASKSEKRALQGLSTTARYNKILSFVINQKLATNSFNGDIKTLNIVINKILEVI